MPADDLPFDALQNLLRLENSSVPPVQQILLNVLLKIPLPRPFDVVMKVVKEFHGAGSSERMALMLTTLQDELRRLDSAVETLRAGMSSEEWEDRTRTLFDLLLDGARKAEETRSRERVEHIGVILAGAAVDPEPIDADDIEEMMRIAMNLSDQDLGCLRELVRVTGPLGKHGRLERYDAYTRWEHGSWGALVGADLDSAFSKLESYGLVSRIAPPNNLNITADFQNRYALLRKGLRFVELLKSAADRKPS